MVLYSITPKLQVIMNIFSYFYNLHMKFTLKVKVWSEERGKYVLFMSKRKFGLVFIADCSLSKNHTMRFPFFGKIQILGKFPSFLKEHKNSSQFREVPRLIQSTQHGTQHPFTLHYLSKWVLFIYVLQF